MFRNKVVLGFIGVVVCAAALWFFLGNGGTPPAAGAPAGRGGGGRGAGGLSTSPSAVNWELWQGQTNISCAWSQGTLQPRWVQRW